MVSFQAEKWSVFKRKKHRDYVLDTSIILPNTLISGFKDKDGTLWFGDLYGQLYKYNRDYDRFSRLNLEDNENVPYNYINVIKEDQNDNLLLGTDGGFSIFNKKLQTFQYYDNNSDLPSRHIISLYVDKNGLIYIGTFDKGLFTFDRSSNKIVSYSQSSDDYSLKGNMVNCIYEDKSNNLWIGTDRGLNLFDRNNNKFINFINEKDNPKSISNDDVRYICEDKNNELWIATFGGGLNKYEKDGSFTNYKSDINNSSSLSNDFITTLFVDNSNVLWIGTRTKGVCKIDLERKKFFTISRFFESSGFSKTSDVASIYQDSSGLFWIATSLNTGIFNFTKSKNGNLIYEGYSVISDTLDVQLINSCFEDNNHHVWFCSKYGNLIQYEKESNSYRIFRDKLRRIFWRMFLLNDDQIFLATHTGFLKFDMTKKEFSDLNPNSDSFRFYSKVYDQQWAYVDREKYLWFTWEGIIKYDIEKDRFTEFKNIKNDTNSLQGQWPNVSGEDNTGNLFIRSNLGLNILNISTYKFTFYPVRIGDDIIEDDSGNFWSGSNSEYGLTKFNPNTEVYKVYDVTDGIQGNIFNYHGAHFKDKDGTLYFGGPNGLTYFNPKEIKDNTYIPSICLTNLMVFNEAVKPSPENPFLKKDITAAKEINLSYKENVFSFEFAALIYNNSSKNQYAYMMEGFDKDWVYCGTRRNVTYTNLDPGEYTFRVKGSNNDGIWNEEGTSIKVIITPPWWQTWWFNSCGAALIFLTAGFGYKKRVSKLKKEKLVQEEYSRKLLASQEEERKRIAGELHDSIAHDILILKNVAVYAMNKTKEDKTKIALNRISEQSAETLNDVRNISYNLHPHQIEALGLTKAIKSIIGKSSGSSKVNFIHDIENIDKIFTEENEIHIYRIIQEAVSNIIKYSDSPEAIIKISCTKKSVSILISDIGKGFDIGNVEKGSLGLSGISERLKMLEGTMDIESKRGVGTVMKIVIPFINT